MMDKKTILVLVSCVAVIMGGQFLIGKLFPPVPKPPAPAMTNAMPSTVAAATNALGTPGVAAPAVPKAPAQPRPPEQIVALSNQFIRVEFTSWGGGIRSIELLKHQADKHSHVVLNADAPAPALTLAEIDGPDAVYEVTPSGPLSVTFRRRDGAVTKEFSLGTDYVLHGRMQVSGAASQTVTLVIGMAAPANAREATQFLGVDWLTTKFVARDFGTITKNVAKDIRREVVESPWVAVKSQFFTMVVTPTTNAVAVGYQITSLPQPADWSSKVPRQGVTASLAMPPTLVSGGVPTYDFMLYAGPKEYKRLLALGKGQEEVMAFGMWGLISVLLLKGLNFFHALIPNYGVAIILVTIVMKIILWPLQAKSVKSMKAMQKFQPHMAKLKEKYKDDKQRLNQETMKLYKEHKINPASSCLPMLVQFPVFIAFYSTLQSAIELRGAPFLWISDLSQPDTIFTIAGLPVNPLPLLMTGSIFWQQKLTPSTGDKQQMMMMMVLMPVMMLFFLYNRSSGLALYWTMQQVLSIVQQWWTLRKPDSSGPAPVVIKAK